MFNAACGDFRSVLKIVLELPSSYSGRLTLVLNDHNEVIMGRTILILILLSLQDDTDDKAIDCAVHLWYSAFLTLDHVKFLRTRVMPVLEVLQLYLKHNGPDGQIPTFGPGRVQVKVAAKSLDWTIRAVNNTLDKVVASITRNSLVWARPDIVERFYFNIRNKLHRRCSVQRYRQTGVLAYSATSVEKFEIPNPSVSSPILVTES